MSQPSPMLDSTLPREIAMLPKVKVLQVDSNLLGPRLAADLFKGPLSESLEELDLTGNVLEEVPESVGSLSKLVLLFPSQLQLLEFIPKAPSRRLSSLETQDLGLL
ncbi:hypothetical protein AK812_SmicGene8823 [Symbiodinium microadriaticum]|uniref:Uncharacterized protein n=1 Tax=Symbiodinium microadriaticum TaxID=2951 RepID=A0A1Q9EJW8_SYMMI|nr:hypothetical protein AK812_SmicGene8823 [Symbiodinium microadriaticum]